MYTVGKTNMDGVPKKLYFINGWPRWVNDGREWCLSQTLANTSPNNNYLKPPWLGIVYFHVIGCLKDGLKFRYCVACDKTPSLGTLICSAWHRYTRRTLRHYRRVTLHWHHNERNGVSSHQRIGPVNSPHTVPVSGKWFHFMTSSWELSNPT